VFQPIVQFEHVENVYAVPETFEDVVLPFIVIPILDAVLELVASAFVTGNVVELYRIVAQEPPGALAVSNAFVPPIIQNTRISSLFPGFRKVKTPFVGVVAVITLNEV
jgi:hypothetical protein